MINKEGKNLLEYADFWKEESKSVITDFLVTKCDKCGNEIKYRLAQKDVNDVEEYIKKLEYKIQVKDESIKEMGQVINDMCSEKQNLLNELIGDRMEQFDDYVIYLLNKYIGILKGENDEWTNLW